MYEVDMLLFSGVEMPKTNATHTTSPLKMNQNDRPNGQSPSPALSNKVEWNSMTRVIPLMNCR